MISDSDLSDDEMIKLKISTLTNSYGALFLTEIDWAHKCNRDGKRY
jgi:hypothetical protein